MGLIFKKKDPYKLPTHPPGLGSTDFIDPVQVGVPSTLDENPMELERPRPLQDAKNVANGNDKTTSAGKPRRVSYDELPHRLTEEAIWLGAF